MPADFGLLFGVIGILITIVGFMIAYIVAGSVLKKEQEKKNPLSSVEQSLANLKIKQDD